VTRRQFSPLDQIVLLAGLEDRPERDRIWALPQLRARLDRLAAAGLVAVEADPQPARTARQRFSGLSEPDGVQAAKAIRHIRLHDLLAEHLPPQARP
jgi:hypothetical protein